MPKSGTGNGGCHFPQEELPAKIVDIRHAQGDQAGGRISPTRPEPQRRYRRPAGGCARTGDRCRRHRAARVFRRRREECRYRPYPCFRRLIVPANRQNRQWLEKLRRLACRGRFWRVPPEWRPGGQLRCRRPPGSCGSLNCGCGLRPTQQVSRSTPTRGRRHQAKKG